MGVLALGMMLPHKGIQGWGILHGKGAGCVGEVGGMKIIWEQEEDDGKGLLIRLLSLIWGCVEFFLWCFPFSYFFFLFSPISIAHLLFICSSTLTTATAAATPHPYHLNTCYLIFHAHVECVMLDLSSLFLSLPWRLGWLAFL